MVYTAHLYRNQQLYAYYLFYHLKYSSIKESQKKNYRVSKHLSFMINRAFYRLFQKQDKRMIIISNFFFDQNRCTLLIIPRIEQIIITGNKLQFQQLNLLDRQVVNQYNQFVMLAALIQQRYTQATSSQNMSLQHLKSLRIKQEETIIRYMANKANFDIYSEIAKACPSQAGLRSIPQDELAATITSIGRVNEFCHPSPKSEMNDETDMLTEEQICGQGYFPFNQPSVNKFMEMEQNDYTWEYIEAIQQEIQQ